MYSILLISEGYDKYPNIIPFWPEYKAVFFLGTTSEKTYIQESRLWHVNNTPTTTGGVKNA